MFRPRILPGLLFLLAFFAPACQAQLGKNVLIPAGSEADRQLKAINDATDPTQKLALMNEFAQANPEGDFAIVADEQLVNYYIGAKQYDKAFEYGDKLFAVDPNNFSNAVNMVRAANEKGDAERLYKYGEKAADIIQRYQAAPPPEGVSAEVWQDQRKQKLEGIKDDRNYIESSLINAAYQQKDPTKKAEYLKRFAKIFPDSPNAEQALSMAAFSYQAAQNRTQMLQVANSTLDKYPNNIGMLILLADDYSEKSEQLDKAEGYAKKAISLCDSAKKPEGVSDVDWQKQITLQKGLALSALGQVNIEKKDNLTAVKSFVAAAPLLKSNAATYARNQYRLGFAYLNLKKLPEAKQALAEAASLDTPYKGPAEQKLKDLAKPAHK
ncbi:MAG TPA: tetratricopeptide repeat protein [Candidatus Acidoferrum sp.]|jgi:tetratricopeptide (TPR) repeat protein